MNLPETETGYSLPHTLVVGDTLGLRRAGILGRKGKHDKRNDVRQHVVQRARQVHRLEEAEARVNVAERTEEAEQQRGQRDALRLPLAEDHNGEGQEAEARHAVFEPPLRNARGNEDDTADAAENARNQHACPAHLIDVDADASSCLRMLAAGHQAQAEAGLVQRHISKHRRRRHQRKRHSVSGLSRHWHLTNGSDCGERRQAHGAHDPL